MMISNESFFAAQWHVFPSAGLFDELQQHPAARNATQHPIVHIDFFMVSEFNVFLKA
jgi:hypothetical protein